MYAHVNQVGSGGAASSERRRESEEADLSLSPAAPPRPRLPSHRGARGVILMAAILHWRTQRQSAPKKHGDSSISGAQERNNMAEIWRHASCEHEEALPAGFGLAIPASEVLASAKQQGYVCVHCV